MVNFMAFLPLPCHRMLGNQIVFLKTVPQERELSLINYRINNYMNGISGTK